MVKFHDRRNAPSTFPLTYYTKMYYAEASRTTASAAFAQKAFTPSFLNQPNDNLSSAADKYRWIDNVNALYEKNIVFGFKYEIKIMNEDSDPCFFCISFRATDDAPASFKDAEMTIGSKTRVLASTLGGPNMWIVKGFVSTRKTYGGINPQTEQEFWGTNGSKPTRFIRFFISAQNALANDTLLFLTDTRISAYCKFFQRDPFLNAAVTDAADGPSRLFRRSKKVGDVVVGLDEGDEMKVEDPFAPIDCGNGMTTTRCY